MKVFSGRVLRLALIVGVTLGVAAGGAYAVSAHKAPRTRSTRARARWACFGSSTTPATAAAASRRSPGTCRGRRATPGRQGRRGRRATPEPRGTPAPPAPPGAAGSPGAEGRHGPCRRGRRRRNRRSRRQDGAPGAQGPQGPQGPQARPQGPQGPAGSAAGFGDNTNWAAAGRGRECTLGEIILTAGAVANGVPANGQLLSIAQNTALFSLLGTTYGGNGQTTFALPDLRGVAPDWLTYSICMEGIYPARD